MTGLKIGSREILLSIGFRGCIIILSALDYKRIKCLFHLHAPHTYWLSATFGLRKSIRNSLAGPEFAVELKVVKFTSRFTPFHTVQIN